MHFPVEPISKYKFTHSDKLKLTRVGDQIQVNDEFGTRKGIVPSEYLILFTDKNVERLRVRLVQAFPSLTMLEVY